MHWCRRARTPTLQNENEETMNENQTVVGVVGSAEQAESAILALQSAGFSRGDVSALFPSGSAAADTLGGRGGTIGLLAGIGVFAVPGLEPLIAAGPLMATLSRGVATVGGLGSSLVKLGILEDDAKKYESDVVDGKILLAVHIESAEERARATDILENAGAHDIGVATDRMAPRDSDGMHSLR